MKEFVWSNPLEVPPVLLLIESALSRAERLFISIPFPFSLRGIPFLLLTSPLNYSALCFAVFENNCHSLDEEDPINQRLSDGRFTHKGEPLQNERCKRWTHNGFGRRLRCQHYCCKENNNCLSPSLSPICPSSQSINKNDNWNNLWMIVSSFVSHI